MVPQHPFPPPQPHFYHQSQPSAFMPSTPVSHQLAIDNVHSPVLYFLMNHENHHKVH